MLELETNHLVCYVHGTTHVPGVHGHIGYHSCSTAKQQQGNHSSALIMTIQSDII